MRPTDVGISFQDDIKGFSYQKAPVIIAAGNIEDLEKKLQESYLGSVGV